MKGSREERTYKRIGWAILWINVIIALLQLSADNEGMVVLHAAVVLLVGYTIRRED